MQKNKSITTIIFISLAVIIIAGIIYGANTKFFTVKTGQNNNSINEGYNDSSNSFFSKLSSTYASYDDSVASNSQQNSSLESSTKNNTNSSSNTNTTSASSSSVFVDTRGTYDEQIGAYR
jgi:predicted PurR-regulated permease PerM